MGARKTTFINAQLDARFGSGSPASHYIGLLTALAGASAAGTEVSTANWTNYARVAVTNNATNFPAASGGTKASGAAIDFGTAIIPSGTVTVLGAAVCDASSGGSQTHFMALGSGDAKPFTCSAAGTLTCYAHGYNNGDSVVLDPIVGASLPTGASASTIYTVANAATDTFTLTGPTISAAGAGLVQKLESKVINNGDSVTIPSGQLVIKET
jgi:hypothetical protein